MDTHKDYFVLCDADNRIVIFDYNQSNPIKELRYSDIEIYCGVKFSNSDKRRIRSISFDQTSSYRIVGLLFQHLICIYNLDDLSSPVAYITIQDYSRNNQNCSTSPYFCSFSFCRNGNLLILTDTEIIKWSYSSSSHIVPVIKLEKPARSIHISKDGGLLEIIFHNEIVLYSINLHISPSKIDFLDYIKRIAVSKGVFDSYFNRETKRYLIGINNHLFLL